MRTESDCVTVSKAIVIVSFAMSPVALVLSVLLWRYYAEQKLYYGYQTIHAGMSLLEVEQVLGRGVEIDQQELPTRVDFTEPDPSKRRRPVVTGRRFYRWEDGNGRRVIIGINNGRVVDKSYWEPSL